MAEDHPASGTAGKQIGNRVREVSDPDQEITSRMNPNTNTFRYSNPVQEKSEQVRL